MTLRNFASKYDLPLSQVKAAVRIPKFATNDVMSTDYDEKALVVEMTAYYLADMRFCIERANKDNEALKKLAELCTMEDGVNGESQHS